MSIIKILLINPYPNADSPFFGGAPIAPLGLMFLAGVLEKNNYDVKIIDAFLEELDQYHLSKKIISENPDIVGITSDSANYFESLRVAGLVKNVSKAIVVMGGVHVTIRPKQIFNYPDVDIVVFGEGEYTMLEIVQRIETGKSLDGCLGCFAKENGNKIYNSPRPRIKELDLLPMPARHLLPFKRYQSNIIISSRGCPYSCTFCSSKEIWGNIYTFRSPEKVVDEIEFLIEKYEIESIYFGDENFTLKRERIIGICNELKRRNIQITWSCSSRVDLVDKELLVTMYDAGCTSLWYGIESGSEKSLIKINKGITLETVRHAVKITREAKIVVGGLIL